MDWFPTSLVIYSKDGGRMAGSHDAEAPPSVSSGSQSEEMLDYLLGLIRAVEDAKTIPGSSKALIDRSEMLGALEVLYDRLPEDVKTARWMVRERERFVARTNEQAREVVERAREKAEELVSKTSIISEATEEANILVRRAEDQARRIRLEAQDYAEDRLARLDDLLVRVLEQVREMRSHLGSGS